MKTMTVALVLATLIGCSKDKAKTATTLPTDDKANPAGAKQQKPAPNVTSDQQVSPGLAIGGDIIAACGIKVVGSANPKFDYDKDELAPEDRAVLDQIAACLTTGALKGKAVSLIGRADPRGTEEYNLGLGSRRSESVSQYLARLGVTKPQLEVTTRGALEATGTDESGWQQDRRVDIQLASN
ncbi:peptidoglycan-associated lipoprotein Pal [soil metagenome]